MRQQTTVNDRFQKVIDAFELSQARKRENIEKSIQACEKRISGLNSEISRLLSDLQRINSTVGPSPPAESTRQEQREESLLQNNDPRSEFQKSKLFSR